MAVYQVKNQWCKCDSSWDSGGFWVLGKRTDQYLVGIDIDSDDCGKTFTGTITYNGEGAIDFKAKKICENAYCAYVHWGAETIWHDEGVWIIGGREDQSVVDLKATYDNQCKCLVGTVEYECEGKMGFKAENLEEKCGWKK